VRVLPLVGAAGILVAITLDVDPIHDIDLFVFEGARVALGVALLRAEHRPRPETASTPGLMADQVVGPDRSPRRVFRNVRYSNVVSSARTRGRSRGPIRPVPS
jgi:hypothetical protein